MANRYFKLYTEAPVCGTGEVELIITDGSDFEVDYDEVAGRIILNENKQQNIL